MELLEYETNSTDENKNQPAGLKIVIFSTIFPGFNTLLDEPRLS